jgi:hypothetical protein
MVERGLRYRWPLIVMLCGLSRPVAAQDSSVDQMIENQRAMFHVEPENKRCPRDPLNDAIVVCRRDHSDRYRIPSTQEEHPESPEARRTGQLVPPDVYGLGPCTGVCIKGGYAPPPVYYFDITALPEPAPGTDAWKIAHGEMPAP